MWTSGFIFKKYIVLVWIKRSPGTCYHRFVEKVLLRVRPFCLKKFLVSKRIVSEQRSVSHEIRLFTSSIRFPFFAYFCFKFFATVRFKHSCIQEFPVWMKEHKVSNPHKSPTPTAQICWSGTFWNQIFVLCCLLNKQLIETKKIISFIEMHGPVLRIRDVYPGSRILLFTHPGSRISDPGSRIQKQQQKREVKKISCHTFLCSHKFHKIVYYFSFEVLKKKIWANFQRIIELFTKKLSKSS